MPTNSFGTHGRLAVGPASFEIFRLHALDAIADVDRLPFSVKVLLGRTSSVTRTAPR